MASAVVMATIDAYVDANWSGTLVTPNSTMTPPADGSAFIEVSYPIAVEEQMSVGAPGNNVWREEGTVRIEFMIPSGTGLQTMTVQADALRAALRGKVLAPASGHLRTEEASPLIPMGDSDDGNYAVHSFQVRYLYDIHG